MSIFISFRAPGKMSCPGGAFRNAVSELLLLGCQSKVKGGASIIQEVFLTLLENPFLSKKKTPVIPGAYLLRKLLKGCVVVWFALLLPWLVPS